MSDHAKFPPSRLQQHELCPGSWKMEQDAPQIPNADADAGTELHRRVATGDTAGTSLDDADLLLRAQEVLSRFSGIDWYHEQIVQLLADEFDIITWGTADVIGVRERDLVLIDWKFGRVPVEAEGNLQIMVYAAAAMQKYNRASCLALVYMPRLNKLTETLIRTTDIPAIIDRVQAIQAACGDGIQLRAGAVQCRYCSARTFCPEARRESTALTTTHSSAITDPAQMVALLEAAEQARKWSESVKYHAKDLAQRLDGVLVGDDATWSIRTRQGAREITNSEAAYQKARTLELSHESIMSCVSMDAKKIEELYARKMKDEGVLTLKAARQMFAEQFADVIERRPDSTYLARKGKDNATDSE